MNLPQRTNSSALSTTRNNSILLHKPLADTRPIPMRNYEIAALRKDGSVYFSQERAPANQLFESAFSAFARGTLIQTPSGDVAIEDLAPGDMITTTNGEAAQLTWIGSGNFVPADRRNPMPLTRIMVDSFGNSRPNMFLTIGPAARILHRTANMRAGNDVLRLLTLASELLDGENVIKVSPPTPVKLFHICLSHHATIFAGGLEAETFHPAGNGFESAPPSFKAKFLSMFPQIDTLQDFGKLAHLRADQLNKSEFN